MPRRFLYALLLLPLCLSGSGAGGQKANSFDWPQWRGPNRDNLCPETGLLKQWPDKGPPLAWNAKEVNGGKGLGTGYSSVSVAHGRIFTMGDIGKDGFVFALDEKTGKILWQTRVSPGQGDGPRCTPTVDGDRVYALSRQGNLACLNVVDGSIKWSLNYKTDLGGKMMSGWDYSESPLIDGDRVICTPGGEDTALVALNKYDGKEIWRAKVPGGGGSGYASVISAEVGGIKMYMTWLRNGLAAVSAQDGKFLWKYGKNANGTANIPTPIVKGDLVFCSTGYGSGSALLKLVPDGKGGVEAKEQYFLKGGQLQNHHGGMVLLGEYVYGGHGHNEGFPFCLHLATGKLKWGPTRGPGNKSAAVLYADGNLYFRYEDGVMALIEATPESFHVISTFQLPRIGGHSWPHPVIANGKLYIREQNMLLCYDVKAK